MAHVRGATRCKRDFHHIEPESDRRMLQRAEVSRRGATEHRFFTGINGMETRDQRGGSTGLHLHENQHFAITRDQINLLAQIPRIAPVPRNDGKRLFTLQKLRRCSLTPGPGILFGCGRQPQELF